MKKTLFKVFGVIGICLLAAGFYMMGQDYEVRIPQQMAQEKAQEKLPMVIKKSGVTGVVKDLELTFLSDNRVQIQTLFDVEGYNMKGHGSADFKSGIYYENGNFYLDRIELIDFILTPTKKTVESNQKAESAAKQKASELWGKFKSKVAPKEDAETLASLEQLKGKALDRFKSEAVPKIKAVVQSQVQDAIESTPIYSLNGKDFKQSLAVMALKDLQFEQEEAIIVLSPGKALMNILMLVVGGLLAILLPIGFLMSNNNGRSRSGS